jgi:tRNA-specific 2-thiouridylase
MAKTVFVGTPRRPSKGFAEHVIGGSKKTVFVGMSGGVDSSVTAGILKDQGYNVVGVHLRCWNVDGCAESDAEDARRAAETLGIPFYVFDFEKEYRQKVVDYMVDGYRKGITPNPDVMCNHEIKFGMFFERAMAMGADYVATGHYVRLRSKRSRRSQVASSKIPAPLATSYSLLAARDSDKDQSYFLWMLTQKQLKKCLFPLLRSLLGQRKNR